MYFRCDLHERISEDSYERITCGLDWLSSESRSAGCSSECSNSLITLQRPHASPSVFSSFLAYWARSDSLIRRFVFRQVDLYARRFALVRLRWYRCSSVRCDWQAMMASELSHWFDGLPHHLIICLTEASWSKIVVTQSQSWAAYPMVSDFSAVQTSDTVSKDWNLFKSIDFDVPHFESLASWTWPRHAQNGDYQGKIKYAGVCDMTSGFSGDMITRLSSPSRLCVDPQMCWTRL